jgi:hypothetical protein
MSSPSSPPKSPILAAVGISLAIALGCGISSLDMAQVEEVATGQFLTRPLAEAQQRNAAALTSLEHTVGAINRDIDFVTARVSATIRRNEDQAYDRFAHLDAEIAALKNRIAGIQHARLAPAPAAQPPEPSQDVSGLRSSVHDLSAAHTGAVTAINKRLERIEVMVGLATDMTSSVSDPAAQKARRAETAAKQTKKQPPAEIAAPIPVSAPSANVARPERGHLFNVKPLSQQGAPLRMSRLPG